MDFCTPHLRLTLAVVTRADDPAGACLDGRRVGVRAGTTAEAYTRAHDNDALRGAVNTILADMEADGTLRKLRVRWGLPAD